MNGVDAIILHRRGVGENSKSSRAAIAEYFGYLGVKIDPVANSKRGEDIMISTPDSKVKVVRHPDERGARHRPRHEGHLRLSFRVFKTTAPTGAVVFAWQKKVCLSPGKTVDKYVAQW